MGCEMSEKNLWNMGLDETLNTRQASYLRVPGGWIVDTGRNHPGVFTPYSDDFKPDDHSIKVKLFDQDKKASLAHGGIDNVTPKDWDAVAKDLYGN
jgi:hypothetical protein